MTRIKAGWIHGIGWALFMSLLLTFMSKEADSSMVYRLLMSGWFWLFGLIYAGIFYLNTHYLIPSVLFRRRYPLYMAIIVGLTFLIVYAQPFDQLIFEKFHRSMSEAESGTVHRRPPNFTASNRPPGPPPEFRQKLPVDFTNPEPMPRDNDHGVDIISLVLFGLVTAVGIATQYSKQWNLSERRAIASEVARSQAELAFFKAQINPHFLFNSLNNIYSLAVSNHSNTAASILKLSNIMRYLTDEASSDRVSLLDEVNCISDYIELQRLRLTSKTQVELHVSGELQGVMIAPLILMTFVENAFKYGVSNHFQSLIDVRVEARKGAIHFFCENAIFDPTSRENNLGIGLANTRRRLAISYPDRHDLQIGSVHNRFRVALELNTDL